MQGLSFNSPASQPPPPMPALHSVTTTASGMNSVHQSSPIRHQLTAALNSRFTQNQASVVQVSTGPVCSLTSVGLTLTLVFHQLAHLPIHFSLVLISLRRNEKRLERSKIKSIQPSLRSNGTPSTPYRAHTSDIYIGMVFALKTCLSIISSDRTLTLLPRRVLWTCRRLPRCQWSLETIWGPECQRVTFHHLRPHRRQRTRH